MFRAIWVLANAGLVALAAALSGANVLRHRGNILTQKSRLSNKKDSPTLDESLSCGKDQVVIAFSLFFGVSQDNKARDTS